ncbi:YtpI family protein [Shimazuella kribbensis]|uniref:YtpI family protein n=1 Tax=Shimazuella kribbensis TaxID=139808 RepID=UPI00041F7254|nr:YtpI family protein [Shimazuella kribbensis]
MVTLTLILIVIMILSLCCTVYFSIIYRRKGANALISRSYMNLSMGILFLALSIHLLTFKLPILGKIFATLILLIGIVNVYYSIKIKRFAEQPTKK